MQEVVGWARRIEARHALFVFDSCFSGTIFKTRSEVPDPSYVSSLTARPVRQFLTAGRAGEVVPQKSIFVPALIRGLSGDADFTEDGYVTGSELALFLQSELAGTGQTPQYGRLREHEYSEGDYVFRAFRGRENGRDLVLGYKTDSPCC